MSRRSGRVRRAINADSEDLSECLKEVSLQSLAVACSSELNEEEKAAMWDLFETNMFDMYSTSSFGWKPVKRKKEIFHNLSRFLIVSDPEGGAGLLAFCMFRFENEEGENVVYCYDIQINPKYHRTGIGKKLVEVLQIIGEAFEMEKIVLTVLKVNTKAIAFYGVCGFQIDPASPSLYLPEDDPSRDSFDYEIMSKAIGGT